MKTMSSMWCRARRSVLKLIGDRSGVAAVEFVLIVPIMLVTFVGTVEFSTGVAMDRKVTLMARTLSDLTSQSLSVANTDITNFFIASNAIMTPYSSTPTQSTLSELYVDPTTHAARVQWSKSATFNSSGAVVLATGRATSSTVTIPSALAVGGTYLIFSEISYPYAPVVDYAWKTAMMFTLADVSYTRPRQSACVIYPTPAVGSPMPPCTTL
jgi:Flp pilus assembly protein TadG